MSIDESNPRWLREVALALPSAPQVILTGNVSDYHVTGDDLRSVLLNRKAEPARLDTAMCLAAVLESESIPVTLLYDAVDGLRTIVSSGSEGQAAGAGVWEVLIQGASGDLKSALEQVRDGNPELKRDQSEGILGHILAVATSEHRVRFALILDFASWVVPVSGDARTGSDATTQLPKLLRRAAKAATTTRPIENIANQTSTYNPIIWITRQQADLPSWLVTARGMRLISIELPTARTRQQYGRDVLRHWPKWSQLAETEQEDLNRQFTSATEGLTLNDGWNIVNLALNIPSKPDWTSKERLRAAERVFRIGVPESQWDDPALIRYLMGSGTEPDCWTRLDAIVAGQKAATQKAGDVLTRSAMGLSGAENSGANAHRPKGVLFLAGPTGTGKTLLAKSIAGILNQDPENYDSYTRFDMSEYSAEHTEARLVGAPPGYVGYDAGGQLTDAVRQRPFSVLLFDEIEKAHPRILDKFLQILDEGRLTDGTGMTVSFSETFIVFTSNLGVTSIRQDDRGVLIAEPRCTYEEWNLANADQPGRGYEKLEKDAVEAITEYFTQTIQRPELLNRIGKNNIVIFDYISDDAATTIIDSAIEGVAQRLKEKRGTELVVTPEALVELHDAVRVHRFLEMGGRGLNAGVETLLVNPLSKAFARLVAVREVAPTAVRLTRVTPELVLE